MTKQEYLAFSLPYGLKCKFITERIQSYSAIKFEAEFDTKIEVIESIPILRPLYDLTKPIEHNGEVFVPLVRLLEHNCFDVELMDLEDIREYEQTFRMTGLITLHDLPLYLEWHFDLFGGIDNGDAIDINSLQENPYK